MEKRQVGTQESSAQVAQQFSSISKTLPYNSQNYTLAFKPWSEGECQILLITESKEEQIRRVITSVTMRTVNVFGTGITLRGQDDVSHVAGPC